MHVSPLGNDKNDGTLKLPFRSLVKALKSIENGDIVRLHKGTYYINNLNFRYYPKLLNKTGNLTIIEGAVNEKVVLERKRTSQNIKPLLNFRHTAGILLKNLEIRGSNYFAIYISDAQNIHLDNLIIHDNHGTGIYISGINGPTDNITIINCDSYNNFNDKTHGENEDGFACAWGITGKVIFNGCRAWNNADDGFDFWMASRDKKNNVILTNNIYIKNSWAFKNGFNIWNSKKFTGDGNGFKFGKHGGKIHAYNLKSWMNASSGFIDNGNDIGMELYNSIAYKNNKYGIVMATDSIYGKHKIKDCISFVNKKKDFVGMKNIIQENNSWQMKEELKQEDFISFDDRIARGKRTKNGELPISSFLELKK